MQKAYLLVLLPFIAQLVNAMCTCDPNDNTCLQICVNTTQHCIEKCNGDNICYNTCIHNYWPGQESSSTTLHQITLPATTMSVHPTSATTTDMKSESTSEAHPSTTEAHPSSSEAHPSTTEVHPSSAATATDKASTVTSHSDGKCKKKKIIIILSVYKRA
ncbi:uncharacterized protein BX663DRAFT_524477 [Cokeromyces recurvatus]|uniref:uncharacterized protein n=1 Tax=Cokeromyces recurvatus TaxID=90255 RepID=UPI00221E935B|nr:uncharacterized protein BX663DRAFT_524477 [Cokeromyces recurvatus]KAI7898535.1 hypothetical protein BX663DRAFT_524477 [Cokeromyces recurvatus]